MLDLQTIRPGTHLRILNVEDDPRDSLLIERELQKRVGPIELSRVDTAEGFAAALAAGHWDVVIADHKLPSFSSLEALAVLKRSGLDLPLIVVSGTMGVDFAVEAMRSGARDYLVKADLVRLGSVVEREVRDAAVRRLAAARHVLTGEVLEALNGPGELADQLRLVLEKLREHAGADAAGVRLGAGEDVPFTAQVGHHAQEGFESLALVPLRGAHGVVGLLQLNARAPDRFGADLIQFLEEIAPSLALAVERRRSEEALRASEERYRVLVETAPNGVALVGADGVIVKANAYLAEMLGQKDSEAMEGLRWIDLVREEDRSRAEAELVGLVAQQGVLRDAPYRLLRGAAAFDAEVSASVARGADGAPNALVFVVRDVTERLRLHARLAQSDRMASVGMLAAGVAHEVNNPLTYVLSNLESLAADLPAMAVAGSPDETRDLARRAEDALVGIRRIRDIVRDLKVFSRAGSDQREPVALNKVIQGVINMAFNEVKYRARLETEFGELPSVLASEGRLAQVFLNLLVNAAHAISEGDVEHNKISLKTWSEGGEVYAEVRDTGSGMTEEVVRQIFDPFFTTKPAGVGSGLGLPISREIVEAAGGRITVETGVGKGSRFLVRLPAMGVGQPPVEPRPVAPPVTTAPARRGHVLVVDDEPLVRASMVRLLRAENDVVEAAGGRIAEALLAGDDRFDVILCDLVMPEMSGMDLHGKLLSTRPDLAARMVFVTGGAFTQRAMAFLDAVSNARIDKPFESVKVRELVRAMVRSRQG
jgi:PAS domain S-box-containing protein